MTQASVGFHCPDCVRSGRRASPVMRLRDLNGSRPIVTEALIALNVVGLFASLVTGGSVGGGGGTISDRGFLLGYGVEYVSTPRGISQRALGVAVGEWYRIITGGFLHAGLLHLAMNMLLLYVIGSQLESLLGRVRYLALYLACLVAGSFGVLLVSPTTPTVGASGAVFGLMGAAVIAVWSSSTCCSPSPRPGSPRAPTSPASPAESPSVHSCSRSTAPCGHPGSARWCAWPSPVHCSSAVSGPPTTGPARSSTSDPGPPHRRWRRGGFSGCEPPRSASVRAGCASRSDEGTPRRPSLRWGHPSTTGSAASRAR
ncbi:MAG: rhomboid family intramembrane serine protease [Actinobacteria bacterium]|nr:rhomboid family intramembrane serine protease [Actinomycetota bacterium]